MIFRRGPFNPRGHIAPFFTTLLDVRCYCTRYIVAATVAHCAMTVLCMVLLVVCACDSVQRKHVNNPQCTPTRGATCTTPRPSLPATTLAACRQGWYQNSRISFFFFYCITHFVQVVEERIRFL